MLTLRQCWIMYKNKTKITIWVYIGLFGKIQWLIGYQISLIVIARQPKYDRFYALLLTHHPPAAQTTPTNAFDFYTSGWPEYFSPLWCCNDKYHFLWLMFGQGRIAIKLLGRAQKPCFSFIISLNGIKIFASVVFPLLLMVTTSGTSMRCHAGLI